MIELVRKRDREMERNISQVHTNNSKPILFLFTKLAQVAQVQEANEEHQFKELNSLILYQKKDTVL